MPRVIKIATFAALLFAFNVITLLALTHFVPPDFDRDACDRGARDAARTASETSA